MHSPPVYRFHPAPLTFGREFQTPLRLTFPIQIPDTIYSQRTWHTTCRYSPHHYRPRSTTPKLQLRAPKTHLRSHGLRRAPYQLEDQVWLHQPYLNRGDYTKLDKPYSGPFVVVQSLAINTYRIHPVSDPFALPLTVNFSRLKSGQKI
ncbi:unnamed protein product [Mesocestoides corti]|uniref:Uncharacterized protein n=1 Tax=Mesocestoides corti TaxID=53468 RepID=A0A0R3U2I8_MESCO|nr:unnamed protein product [Mesocestoides corti]